MRITTALIFGVFAVTMFSGIDGCKGGKGKEDTVTPPSSASPVAILQAAAAATPTPLPCSPSGGTGGGADTVPAGTYCVCNVEGSPELQHSGSLDVGKHLAVGDTVVIGTLDDATDVKLGANQFRFLRSADGKELSALIDYPHTTTAGPGNQPPADPTTKMITHVVKISRDKPVAGSPLPGCAETDPTKTILVIGFCFKGKKLGVDQWLCSPEVGGTHLGDVHVQN